MRKILLLGTIFVATSALAFSGVFGGGSGSSKQATYSGGADAIGVHFNGKPADSGESEEAGCPAEKQCGDYCCGYDNVCNKETNECCSEELNHCCPSGKTAYFAPWHANDCCTGEVYCAMNDATGNCYSPYVWYCCAPGKKIIPLPVRSDGMQGFACCADDETPYYYRGSSACCSGTLSPGTGPSGEDECLQ